MTRSLTAMLLVAASISVAAPQTVEAQLGGLIKKKVKEAIKPPEKPAPASPGATDQPAVSGSGSKPGEGLPRGSFGELLITPETLTRLTRGLDAELALMADFQKILSKYPTLEQYEDCQRKAMMTPEGQKIVMKLGSLPENATVEQSQALIAKVGEESVELQKKKCPNDPHDWSDYRRSERMRQIHEKAASMARAGAVSGTNGHHETGKPLLLFEVNPYEALPDSATDTVLVLGVGGLSPRDYSMLIERVVHYCGLRKTADMSPGRGTVKVKGFGKDIFWVYTGDELAALQNFACDSFMTRYASIVGGYQ